MSGQRPLVKLPDFPVLFCARHLHPLKAAWPAGAGLAALGLFNAFQADERAIRRSCGRVEKLPKIMQQVKPVCCWLSLGVAEEVIQLALDGKCYGMPVPPTGESYTPPAP